MKRTSTAGKADAAAAGGVVVRKGPWTEQEDMKLVWFVRLFGQRRWDFLAKVSGLNRTGKSCRLRWVNYLHPDLKRGRMTPDEERLVLHLHAKWGNRWSRIAKSMPGRTDNEIKNYWRTHMRKQDKSITRAPSASTSTSTSTAASPTTSSSSSNDNLLHAHGAVNNRCASDEEDAATAASQEAELLYTGMDQLLWNDDMDTYLGGAWSTTAAVSTPSSPVWDYCSDSLWGIADDEEYKKMLHAS